MLRLAGENGVAAITILLYSQFLFNALFLGFSMGVAPVISYNYGAKNTGGLKSVCKICRRFVIVSSIIITICCNLLSEPIVLLFVGGKTATYDLAVSGFSVFCVTFLFSGYNIFHPLSLRHSQTVKPRQSYPLQEPLFLSCCHSSHCQPFWG